MREFITESREETIQLGKNLAKAIPPGSCLALIGKLGAGKTTLVKGLAEGLQIEGQIVSPTFLLIKEYTNGRLPLYHIDAYRISQPQELVEVGVEDYLLRAEGITVIEWAEKIREILPPNCIEVKIEIRGKEKRKFTFKDFQFEFTEGTICS